MNYSKKVKLPKRFWVKGRSKFLFCRLIEEGLSNINQIKIGNSQVVEELTVIKQTFWQRLKDLILKLFKIKKYEPS